MKGLACFVVWCRPSTVGLRTMQFRSELGLQRRGRRAGGVTQRGAGEITMPEGMGRKRGSACADRVFRAQTRAPKGIPLVRRYIAGLLAESFRLKKCSGVLGWRRGESGGGPPHSKTLARSRRRAAWRAFYGCTTLKLAQTNSPCESCFRPFWKRTSHEKVKPQPTNLKHSQPTPNRH